MEMGSRLCYEDDNHEDDDGTGLTWMVSMSRMVEDSTTGDAENEDYDDCWLNILKVIMVDTFKRCDRNNTHFFLKIHFLSNLNLDVNILVSRFD